jgi:hypothetical protein
MGLQGTKPFQPPIPVVAMAQNTPVFGNPQKPPKFKLKHGKQIFQQQWKNEKNPTPAPSHPTQNFKRKKIKAL